MLLFCCVFEFLIAILDLDTAWNRCAAQLQSIFTEHQPTPSILDPNGARFFVLECLDMVALMFLYFQAQQATAMLARMRIHKRRSQHAKAAAAAADACEHVAKLAEVSSRNSTHALAAACASAAERARTATKAAAEAAKELGPTREAIPAVNESRLVVGRLD